MYEEPDDDPGSLIHGSRELQIQIVLSGVVVLVFALVVVILPLLFTPPDPIIALIFSLLLAAGGAFLGGSLIFGYFKVRVGAEARRYAQEMFEKAFEDGHARKSMEELFLDEKERLVAELEEQKRQYFDELQGEFNKRLDEEENALMNDVRREFEKQMEAEKQLYLTKVDEDIRGQVTEEHKAYQDSVKSEYTKRLEDEKKAYQKAIREEFEKRLQEEKKANEARIAEHDAELQAQKRKFSEQVADLEGKRRKDVEENEAKQAVFDEHIQSEKKIFSDQLAETEKHYQAEKKALEEALRVEFERKADVEKQAYTDIIRKDFEYWKKEFTDAFRKEIMRDVPPEKPPEPPKPEPSPPWVKTEEPAAPKAKEDLSDIFPKEKIAAEPASAEEEVHRSFDFKSMGPREQVGSAVELLLSAGGKGVSLTFRNSKTRRQVELKARGKDILFEAAVDEISIKSRLMLREFAAQNKLPMEKNDDYIRISFGSDERAVKDRLKEALETAFATPIENLAFDVKTAEN
ncbi:MAG: hypothetical protein V1875_06100 [Candidatus Altiarchaeota archaeon]